MKHETQLAVFRTQRSCVLRLHELFIAGEIDPKLGFRTLSDCDHQVPLEFCSGISLGPPFYDISCAGPAAVAQLPAQLELLLPRKFLRQSRNIQRQSARLLVNQQIGVGAHHAGPRILFLSFLNFPYFLNFIYSHHLPPARATTFSAPSFIPSAMVNPSSDWRRISWPCFTLVPSMRTTMGTFSCSSFAAATTPVASTSQRRMPPKMLMKTAFTFASLTRILNAFFTCSADAPPPTSRKFAGELPASLIMSIVAMARPAPFTMQPTLPSSLM